MALLLDEDSARLKANRELLEAEGLRVICCTTWDEVNASLWNQRIDVAILDDCQDESGERDRIGSFRLRTPWTRVILRSPSPNASRSDRAGSLAYLEKSDDDQELLRLVQRAIQESLTTPLSGSDSRFLEFADVASEVFSLVNAENTQTLYINSAYEQVFGRSCQSLYDDPRSFLEIVHPEDRQRMQGWSQSQIGHWEDGKVDIEYRIIRPDGEVRWIHSRRNLMFDAHGVLLYRAGIAADITDRKRAEMEMNDRLHRLATMNRINRIISDGTELEATLGLLLSELSSSFGSERAWLLYPCDPQAPSIGVAIEHTHPDFPGAFASGEPVSMSPPVADLLKATLESEGPLQLNEVEVKAVSPDLAEVYQIRSQVHLALYPKVGKPWVLGMHQCTRERTWTEAECEFLEEIGHRISDALTSLQAKRELETIQRRFTELTGHIQEILWVMNKDLDHFIYISPAAEPILGLTAEQLCDEGRHWIELVLEEDLERLISVRTREALESGRFDLEYRIRRPDGEVRWIHDRGFPIRNDRGGVDRFAGIAQDITDRKQQEANRCELEEELRQAQKMEAVGQLAAGVAHDINNVLTAILGHADMLSLTTDPKKIQESVQGIQKATHRASGVAHSLLTFSRKTQSNKVRGLLGKIVAETVRWLRHMLPASIEIIDEIEDNDNSWCEIDTSQIQQIIMNLAVNARDAMPEGGILRVSVSTVLDASGEKQVLLDIIDTGHGMSEEVRAHLFEPFYTTKERGQGTGLGLAIVHGLVIEHGGQITVTSEPNEGTRFSIVLPHKSVPATQPQPEEKRLILPRGTGTILLAEDQQQLQDILSASLRAAGFEVLPVSDGLSAFEQYQRHELEIDALVLDIDLPKRSGYKILEDIRESRPDIPAILISGYPDAITGPLPERTLFLEKPFRSLQLCEKLEQLLSSLPSRVS